MNIRLRIQLFISILILNTIAVSSQDVCRVLLPGLDSLYVGACKKGLAHGQGEAWGSDHYVGKFKKGLPDGEGVYEYAGGAVYEGSFKNGLREGRGTLTLKGISKDSIMTGMWENNKYTGLQPDGPGYKVTRKINVERYRVYREGDGNKVTYKLNMISTASPGVSGVVMSGSTGLEFQYAGYYGYESITFPFQSNMRFSKLNKLRTARHEVNFEIEITEPGNWIIEIY